MLALGLIRERLLLHFIQELLYRVEIVASHQWLFAIVFVHHLLLLHLIRLLLPLWLWHLLDECLRVLEGSRGVLLLESTEIGRLLNLLLLGRIRGVL